MEKLKLFEITFNKLSVDRSYMAYYLDQLMKVENKTKEEIIQWLGCSVEDFYKLALCKVPDNTAPDTESRIKKIAEYSNTPETLLYDIIGVSIIKAQSVRKPQQSILAESWDIFKRLMPIPNWAYQPLLTTLVIILFVIPVFSQNNETKGLQLYIGDYVHYTDSVKSITSRDNTLVHRNNL